MSFFTRLFFRGEKEEAEDSGEKEEAEDSIAGKLKSQLKTAIKKTIPGKEVDVWVMSCTQESLVKNIQSFFRTEKIPGKIDQNRALKGIAFQFAGSEDIWYWRAGRMQHIAAGKIGIDGLQRIFGNRIDAHLPTLALDLPVNQTLSYKLLLEQKLKNLGLKMSDLQSGILFKITMGNAIAEFIVDEKGYFVLQGQFGNFIKGTKFLGFELRGGLQTQDGSKTTEPVTKMVKGPMQI